MTHLAVKVKHGLDDLGEIWEIILNQCPKLDTLTLVFYHDTKYWMQFLSDMVLMPEPKPKIDVKLYTSIWAQDTTHGQFKTNMEAHLKSAARRRIFMGYKTLPTKIQNLCISASTCNAASYGLLTTKVSLNRSNSE